MSLILEALRKLDGERASSERGFLVVAATAVPRAARGRPVWLAVLLVGLTGAAVGAGWLLRGKAAEPSSPARSRAAAPAPVPTPRPVAAPITAAGAPAVRPTPRPEARTHAAMPAPAEPLGAAPAASAPARAVGAGPGPAGPTPRAAPSPPALVLQAISERDGRPVALVSDRLVREGDVFDGVTIVRIGATEVEIEWRGERRVLRF